MRAFGLYVGIDYSGAKTPNHGLSGLQIYVADGGEPRLERNADGGHWTRRRLYEWLVEALQTRGRVAVGIDHAFGFPLSYLDRHGLSSYEEFLRDFASHWPTDGPTSCVDDFRIPTQQRTGCPCELRLTDRWTSSAKSVFLFDVAGQVAKSTHAGLPWLRGLRAECGGVAHFWPFDGWSIPDDRSFVAEVYPSILRHRYDTGDRGPHEQDAYVTASLYHSRPRGWQGGEAG